MRGLFRHFAQILPLLFVQTKQTPFFTDCSPGRDMLYLCKLYKDGADL